MDRHSELLIEGAKELGVLLDAETILPFEKFLHLLLEWNQKFNLTAIRDPKEIVVKHFIDSLTLVPFLKNIPAGCSLLDIGTGAGFPGIPVAIVRNDLTCTLLDATQKKVRFLEIVRKELGLINVFPEWGRAENMTQKFDVVTARAVGPIENTIALTLDRTKQNGLILLQRGPKDDALLTSMKKNIQKQGGEWIALEKFQLPQSLDARRIWRLQKKGA